jgi:uncharacterized protein (TIGR02646 family)
LATKHHGKCCYCEIKTKGDVEHFRPKSSVKQAKGDTPQKPAYFWLTYEWDNLLYACGECNSKKLMLFPLEDPSQRATPASADISGETPLLINPATDDPAEHIIFEKDGFAVGLTSKGQTSIEVYALNRSALIENMKASMELLLEPLAECLIAQTNGEHKEAERARKKFVAKYEEYTQPHIAFSGCIESAFKKAYQRFCTPAS